MSGILDQIILAGGHLLPIGLTILCTALTGLVAKHVYNLWARGVVQRALVEVFTAMQEVWQTYVSALKAANADGTLTAEEKAEALRRALSIAKENIGVKGLKRLARVLGLSDVERWLANKVESAVMDSKRLGAAAGMNASPGKLLSLVEGGVGPLK